MTAGERSHAHVLSADSAENILLTARLLREGGVAVIPTDTVYGLAASVFQPSAVERLFRVKQRDASAAVPVLLSSAADISLFAARVPRIAWKVVEAFWPGPVTVVLPARDRVSRLITGGGSTVALRVPSGHSCLRLLEVLGEPLIGTSANISGQPPAITALQASTQLGDRVDAVLAADGEVEVGSASTVIAVEDDCAVIHRIGVVGPDAVRAALGPAVRVALQLTTQRERR